MIFFLVCLFADDETYISVKSFDKSVSVKSSTLGPSFIRNDLLERYLLKWIKSLVEHSNYCQKYNFASKFSCWTKCLVCF